LEEKAVYDTGNKSSLREKVITRTIMECFNVSETGAKESTMRMQTGEILDSAGHFEALELLSKLLYGVREGDDRVAAMNAWKFLQEVGATDDVS